MSRYQEEGKLRRLFVVAVIVAALSGAGVAGAIVEDNTIAIKPGQFARLGTTSIYCGAYVETGTNLPAFDCGDFAGNAHVGGTYSAILDRTGVEVDHWDTSGRNRHAIAIYHNP
jgi:hypothetical protein